MFCYSSYVTGKTYVNNVEWTLTGKKMREKMRNAGSTRVFIAEEQRRRGPRKSGHRRCPDIMLTVDKYCLSSLNHGNSIDRVKY